MIEIVIYLIGFAITFVILVKTIEPRWGESFAVSLLWPVVWVIGLFFALPGFLLNWLQEKWNTRNE